MLDFVTSINTHPELSPSTEINNVPIHSPFLVLESEVESLIALVGRGSKILQALFLGHGAPFLVSLLVPIHIVRLHEEVNDNVHAENCEQLPVATHVPWLVVCMARVSCGRQLSGEKKSQRREASDLRTFSVDVRGYNATCLHKHVIAGS